ncbi:glycosyltransferase [Lichenihabitans sp. Uapishka_5]|uniref:glycosyltransferase family protein n=1 Tax=Lichenihabitans sp. Uapishka_5 TaxID=3037302 RepID=UPI0029E802C5|nr:glycosyltransferase [Lichenihabitans sp. Uapishka_5]MDX7950627.1 glycosyltransferase [Lichenihabitans sp. Uapishka_5]
MYSHDTFGLGHLRRCRAIAHALVERFKGVHVLIVSGSSIAGAFEFRTRVDFLKVPSIIKLMNGEYTPLADHTDLQGTLDLRRSLILGAAESFQPDLFIVDKEPLGLRGELEPTLQMLRDAGTTLVLGLRDVMDSPRLLAAEWSGADVLGKMEALYHQIWVYGPEDFYDPLQGLDVSAALRARLRWTGFLKRELPAPTPQHGILPADALLLTTGGGGDGAALVRQVIDAYALDASLTWPVLLVLGPFMRTEDREEIRRRATNLAAFTIIDFDNRMEALMDAAAGVVSMGGYNTFCEILSFDRRALIVPRTQPREEQLLRARRAAALGLVEMILPEEAADPAKMAAALKRLAVAPRPSETRYGSRPLGGLPAICDLVQDLMAARLAGQPAAAR